MSMNLLLWIPPPALSLPPFVLPLPASSNCTMLLAHLSALRPPRPIACPNLGSFSALPLLHSQICSSLRDRSLWAPPLLAERTPRGSRNLASTEPAEFVRRRATDRPAGRPIDRPTEWSVLLNSFSADHSSDRDSGRRNSF